jgi:Flp pilus assembly protein TadG
MMDKKLRKVHEKGQSMVELALSFGVLLFLLMGVIDLGRAFFTFSAMRDAAQEGAVFASIYPLAQADTNQTLLNTAAIENRVRTASDAPVDLTNPDIVVTTTLIGTKACNGAGIRINVDWDNFPLIFPLWEPLFGRSTVPIHAQVEDTILRPPCQ